MAKCEFQYDQAMKMSSPNTNSIKSPILSVIKSAREEEEKEAEFDLNQELEQGQFSKSDKS